MNKTIKRMKKPNKQPEICTTDELKLKAQKISIMEGSSYSLMDGFGLRYVTPYALSLGANNSYIGVLNTLPFLVGSFSELFAIKTAQNHSRKKIVFWSVLAQAFMWLIFIGIGAMFFKFGIDHTIAPTTLIIAYTILISLGMFAVPSWMSWMKDVVPVRCGTYFGVRARITGFVALVCMLIAGYVLDYFKKSDIFIGFTILFLIAFIGRLGSALLFTKQHEPKFKPDKDHHYPLWQFFKTITNDNFGKFTIFVSLMSLMVAIASPFFAVYMLRYLKLSYVEFTLISMSSIITTLLFITAWGRFSDVYGNFKMIKITGYLIPLVPLLWLASPFLQKSHPAILMPYLLIVEGFSGMVWAGFNLGTSDFIYDMASPQKMGMFVAYFNILNNIGMFIGALIGGFISSIPFMFIGLPSILVIFLISGIARFGVAGVLLPNIHEVNQVKEFSMKEAEDKIAHLSIRHIFRIIR